MGQDEVEPTEYSVGDYVLMSYLVRPISKLHARWAGPYEVTKRGDRLIVARLDWWP